MKRQSRGVERIRGGVGQVCGEGSVSVPGVCETSQRSACV